MPVGTIFSLRCSTGCEGKERPGEILGAVLLIVAKLVAMIVTFQWFRVMQRCNLPLPFAMSIEPQYEFREAVNIGEDCEFCRLFLAERVGVFLGLRDDEARHKGAAARYCAAVVPECRSGPGTFGESVGRS
jgi:hypothetical protein